MNTKPIKVLFLPQYDETGASSRIRIYQFLKFMPEHNIQATVRPLITGDCNNFFKEITITKNSLKLIWILFKVVVQFLKRYINVIEGWFADVVFIQKDVLPFGLLPILFLGQKHIIYDFDDAIWEENPASSGSTFISKSLSRYRRYLLNRILSVSSIVFVDNEYLAVYAKKFCPNVIILSAPVDAFHYVVKRETVASTIFYLGWIGSPSTTYLLQGIIPALESLSEKVKIILLNIGGLQLHSDKFMIENIPWSIDNEIEYLAIMNAGLMPLDNTPFNRGRLGYKLVQYLSAGVPIIAADVGLNKTIVFQDKTGVLYNPDDVHDFVNHAYRLLTDKDLLKSCSDNAVKLAREKYHIGVQISLMIQAINNLANTT